MKFLEAAAVVAKAGEPMLVRPKRGVDGGYEVVPVASFKCFGVVMSPAKAKALVEAEKMYS